MPVSYTGAVLGVSLVLVNAAIQVTTDPGGSHPVPVDLALSKFFTCKDRPYATAPWRFSSET